MIFSATITVDAADADTAAMPARVYCVKLQKNGKTRMTAWFASEAVAAAWEAEFGERLQILPLADAGAQERDG